MTDALDRTFEYIGKFALAVGISAFIVAATPFWILGWMLIRFGVWK